MEEIEFSRWLFEGRPRQGKNVLPDGLNWLCYFAGNSKSYRGNLISFIFLEFPNQVDMKNVVKCQKHYFGYFNALKTHGGMGSSIVDLTLPSKYSQPAEAKETRGNIARVFSTYSPHIILNVNCDLNLAMPKVLKTP